MVEADGVEEPVHAVPPDAVTVTSVVAAPPFVSSIDAYPSEQARNS